MTDSNKILTNRERKVKYDNIDDKKPAMINARKYRQKISDKLRFMDEE